VLVEKVGQPKNNVSLGRISSQNGGGQETEEEKAVAMQKGHPLVTEKGSSVGNN